MSLHVNGFCIAPRKGSTASPPLPCTCRLWSPFSLVEKCQVKAKQNDAQWAIFKMTIFRKEGQDASYYFANTGPEAQLDRDTWVEQIVQAVSGLTLSLFPKFEISVNPVPGRAATSTRILAGYLLQGSVADKALLVFCELHAYLGREARLALYQDEWCDQEVLSIAISDSSIVSTRKGAYCTVFGINDQLFCARTEDERELWLRAVSNIKVKLMFDAPDPTAEELEVFRLAVHERAEALPVAAGHPGAAVLPEAPRKPPPGPAGDAGAQPEPLLAEDEAMSFSSPAWGDSHPHSPESSSKMSPPPLPGGQAVAGEAGSGQRPFAASMGASTGAEIAGL